MLRRGCPSRWVYREFRDEGDPITANFKIQLNDDEGSTGPFRRAVGDYDGVVSTFALSQRPLRAAEIAPAAATRALLDQLRR